MRGPVSGLLALLSLLLPLTLDAQDREPRRLDVSLAGGALWSTDWSDLVVLGSAGGLVERVLARDLRVSPGTSGDLTVTYWEGRYGFRVHGGFSGSCLAVGPGCRPTAAFVDQWRRLGLPLDDIDVNTWSFDIGGAVMLVEPKAGQRVRPYVLGSVGVVIYDVDSSIRNLLPTFVSLGGRPGRVHLDPETNVIIIVDDADPFLVSVDEPGLETQFAGVLGFGTDFRIPLREGALGLRLEIADHITRSPLNVKFLTPVDDHDHRYDLDDDGVADAEIDFGLVHNLRFSAGLVFEFPFARNDRSEAE